MEAQELLLVGVSGMSCSTPSAQAVPTAGAVPCSIPLRATGSLPGAKIPLRAPPRSGRRKGLEAADLLPHVYAPCPARASLAARVMREPSRAALLFLEEPGETFPTNALLDRNMRRWTGLNYSCILDSWPK